MNIDEAYIGFNPNRNIIASDDYSVNSSEILATTKCVVNAIESYSEMTLDTKADDSTVVHNTGNEEIDGRKTFVGTTREGVEGNAAGFNIKNTVFTKGLNDKAYYWTITFIDGNEEETELTRRLGLWETCVDANNDTLTGFYAHKNVAGVTQYRTGINVKYTHDDIKSLEPISNGDVNLGNINFRWAQLIAATTAISTSDARLKSEIEIVPDKVLDAWEKVKWKQFKMNDSIAEKGSDKARIHNGLIAQEIDEIFKKNGIDARKYGLFCFDEWKEYKDGDGKIVPAGNQYSLRYEEALCLEAACQRRRADRAEKKIEELEKRLAKLEAKLSV